MRGRPPKITLASGQEFGRLTIVSDETRQRRQSRGTTVLQWLCRCVCGTELWVDRGALTHGNTRSCGCLNRDSQAARSQRPSIVYYRNHEDRLRQDRGVGVAGAYVSWQQMWKRVRHPVGKSSTYAGMTIDPRWQVFANFLADMGERPEGMSLDRIDTTLGQYGPGLCRWATPTVQSRNRRGLKMSEEKASYVRARYAANDVSQQALANELDVSQSLISAILRGETW